MDSNKCVSTFFSSSVDENDLNNLSFNDSRIELCESAERQLNDFDPYFDEARVELCESDEKS